MVTGQYIKLNSILEAVRRVIPNAIEINRADAVEWTWHAVSEIASKGVFYEIEKFIEVRDNKAELPADLDGIIAISYIHDDPDDLANPTQYEYNTRVMMDTTSEPFMLDGNSCSSSNGEIVTAPRGYRYFIKNNYIFTTFNEGIIQIQYTAFPTDDNNEPLVPRQNEVIEAIKWYIIHQVYTIMFYKDSTLSPQMQHSESMWINYGNKAKAALLFPNDDKMHEIYQSTARILPLGLWRNSRYRYNDANLVSGDQVASLLNPTV